MLCDNLNGKEIQKRQDICKHITYSPLTLLYSRNSYIIKQLYSNKNFKKKRRRKARMIIQKVSEK